MSNSSSLYICHFLLPRDSKHCGNEPIEYPDGDLRIEIFVLPQEKAKEALQAPEGMVLTKPDGPDFATWQITTTPHKHFYDVIAVLVIGSVANQQDILNPIVRAKYFNAAIKAARRFLNFCRALSRDAQIYFNSPDVNPESLVFVGFPHCEGWFDPYSRVQIGTQSTNFCSGEMIGGRTGIESISWDRLRSEVTSANQPPIEILALLDAQIALAHFDDQRAVLLAAVAAEVAIKRFLQRTNLDKDHLKKLEDSLEIAFWEKYYDLLLSLAGQPSLKVAIPELYQQVEVLFRVRNKIAHEGICYLVKDGKSAPIVLKHLQIAGLVSTATNVIDWLGSLTTLDGGAADTA
jgi:hypothetical protein